LSCLIQDEEEDTKSCPMTMVNDDDDLSTSNTMCHDDVPQKNTFIHFDLPRSRPPTPTSSAPSILLRRLFKTKAVENTPSDDDIKTDLPVSSISSRRSSVISMLNDNTTTQVPDFDQVSEASTSVGGSLADVAPSQSGFAIDCRPVLEMHRLGQCTPCNYFLYKVDGCRQGSDCSFCHLCPKGEIKKRKKDKMKQLRKDGILRR